MYENFLRNTTIALKLVSAINFKKSIIVKYYISKSWY